MSGANSVVQERNTEAPPPAWGKQNKRIVLLCPALGVTPFIQLVVASNSFEDATITSRDTRVAISESPPALIGGRAVSPT